MQYKNLFLLFLIFSGASNIKSADNANLTPTPIDIAGITFIGAITSLAGAGCTKVLLLKTTSKFSPKSIRNLSAISGVIIGTVASILLYKVVCNELRERFIQNK